MVTDHIERFTEKGLLLASGTELEADIIVTATGLELLFLGGIALRVDGEVVDPATRLTYKGMMIEGVPNLAVAIGYVNASWTLKCDLTCDYVCRLLNHMRARGLTQSVARNLEGAAAEDGPVLGLTLGLHPALRPPPAQAGQPPALAGVPELSARLPGAEDERHRGLGHAVLRSFGSVRSFCSHRSWRSPRHRPTGARRAGGPLRWAC